MDELIKCIAKSLVDNPDKVKVNQVAGEQTSFIELRDAKEDFGKIIGKRGRMAHNQDRLDKIEENLKQCKAIKERDKNELLTLLAILRIEISELSRTHHEEAESIVRFVELSAHEATSCEKSPMLFNLSIEGLTSSVQGFEISHPRLAAISIGFCTMLANSAEH